MHDTRKIMKWCLAGLSKDIDYLYARRTDDGWEIITGKTTEITIKKLVVSVISGAICKIRRLLCRLRIRNYRRANRRGNLKT